jgi:dihydrofolate synthase/folylpolyglutamate synthase
VFEQKAAQTGSPLYYADKTLTFEDYQAGKMICSEPSLGKITIGLAGNYQLKNMATVIKAVDILRDACDFRISEENLLCGMKNVTEFTGLRGRWETVANAPLIIIDTGHNLAGIACVVKQLQEQKFRKLHIIFGVVNDKDIGGMLKLLPVEAEYYFTQAAVKRALPATELFEKANACGLKGKAYLSIKEAFEAAKSNASSNDLIFAGGSNFVAGEFLCLPCFSEKTADGVGSNPN